MNSKWIKRIITVLSVGSFVLLLLPVFRVGVDGTEYVVRGINLTEFSVWGSIVLMIPLIILTLLYSHMSVTQKTVGIIATQCVNLIGIHTSFCGAKEWVEEISSHYVRPEPYLFAYAALVTITLIVFYLYNEYLENATSTCLSFLKSRNPCISINQLNSPLIVFPVTKNREATLGKRKRALQTLRVKSSFRKRMTSC